MNFKDEYKNAAGDLTPDRACVDRMKAAVLRDISRPKVFPYKRVAVVGGAFAACAVITVAAITVIPMLRSSGIIGGEALNAAMSCDFCESAVIYSSDGAHEEAGAKSDTNGNVSSQSDSDAYFEEAVPAEPYEDWAGRNPTVGGPMSDDTAETVSHDIGEPEMSLIEHDGDITETSPKPNPGVFDAPENEDANPCGGDEPVPESVGACEIGEVGTYDSGIGEGFPPTGDNPSYCAVGECETGDAGTEEPGYAPPPRDTVTGESAPEEPAEETGAVLSVTEEAAETYDISSIMEPNDATFETEGATEEITAEAGNPCTGGGVPPPLPDGIVLVEKEELFGEGTTALRIIGNSAMIMNGDDVLIAYEAVFVPRRIPSESDIPRTGAAMDKYEAEGEYLVCSDDKNLIYVFDRQSEVFINAYRKIS